MQVCGGGRVLQHRQGQEVREKLSPAPRAPESASSGNKRFSFPGPLLPAPHQPLSREAPPGVCVAFLASVCVQVASHAPDYTAILTLLNEHWGDQSRGQEPQASLGTAAAESFGGKKKGSHLKSICIAV